PARAAVPAWRRNSLSPIMSYAARPPTRHSGAPRGQIPSRYCANVLATADAEPRAAPLALAERGVGSEGARLDHHIVDHAAVAKDAMPLAQSPIDRRAPVEPDIEPFVKAAHQRWCELTPRAVA